MAEQEQARGNSPYARQHKTPHRYSEQYYAWRSAAVSYGPGSPQAVHADHVWQRRFGLDRPKAIADSWTAEIEREFSYDPD